MVRQNKRIDLLKGDITRIQADAIVNAANSSLLGGGGVDGVIHRKGGPVILEECRQIRNKQGGCPAGEAVITTAGMLPARYVIHTVGPVWNQNKNQDHLLASCYTKSLDIAVAYQLRSIAFPNISTGIYHFPKDRAAAIAVDAVMKFLEQDNQLQKVIFVCFDPENYEIYRQLLNYEQQVKNND